MHFARLCITLKMMCVIVVKRVSVRRETTKLGAENLELDAVVDYAQPIKSSPSAHFFFAFATLDGRTRPLAVQ